MTTLAVSGIGWPDVSAYGFQDVLSQGRVIVDPTRIAAQVVSGIGFLGAGAITRQGLSVRGLTTAASLWLVAAIGMAAGVGFDAGAVIATAGALLTLGPLRAGAFRLLRPFMAAHDRLLVEIPAGGRPAPIIEAIERRSVGVDVELAAATASVAVLAGVAEIDGVLEVQWTD